MHSCHCLETPVTPFASFSNAAGRQWGDRVVEGVLGVIHRDFEEQWRASHPDQDNRFGMGLLVANFGELKASDYIPPDYQTNGSIEHFCDGIVAILERFPRDERGLVDALRDGTLAGKDFRSYAGTNEVKFFAFCDFIRSLRIASH